jgi:dihydrofolate synthase/folylpolyglutamate synthase
VSFTERIRINGTKIPERRVVELARRLRHRYRGAPALPGAEPVSPTFFEVTTALAFAYLAEEGVDIAVVETGMGGRLDSTNVITPLVSVITNIDLEHTEFLGATTGQIAEEKAGIIKPAVPVVTGVAQPEVIRVIEREASARSAPVFRMGEHFLARNVSAGLTPGFDYEGIVRSYAGLRIAMRGRHQVGNASLAVAAVECLNRSGFTVPESAVRRGLEKAAWEGRLEKVSGRPDILLDGAHNPASAAVLAEAVGELRPLYRKLVLVVGILMDKDYRGILSSLLPLADHVVVTRPRYSRALNVETLAEEIRALGRPSDCEQTVGEAIGRARQIAGADDLILITGSLYTVGDARAVLVGEEQGESALKGLTG